MRTEETAFLSLTDIHYGAECGNFNPDILRKQMQHTSDAVVRERDRRAPSTSFDRLVVYLGGDTNDGQNIYATQPMHQRVSNVEQQADECSDMLAGFLKDQRSVWGKVDVYCVAGNHGRTGRKEDAVHERASWDIVAYRYLRHKVQGDGIPVLWDDRDPYYYQPRIRGHRYVLHHGHDIITSKNPQAPVTTRVAEWAMTNLVGRADCVVMGHVHSPMWWTVGPVNVIISGTPKFGDGYAFRRMGRETNPLWFLHGISNALPVAWLAPIDLDYRKWPGYAPDPEPQARAFMDRGGLTPIPAATRAHLERVHDISRAHETTPPVKETPVVLDPPLPRTGFYRDKPCAICTKAFTPRQGNQRYCDPCVNGQVCKHCGETIPAKRGKFAKRDYCGQACVAAARRGSAA